MGDVMKQNERYGCHLTRDSMRPAEGVCEQCYGSVLYAGGWLVEHHGAEALFELYSYPSSSSRRKVPFSFGLAIACSATAKNN